ncbi:acyl-CoA dehydrogenase [Bradyrhizobium sediminis]|uniref:Acyl-CoA dehydrogenase n=1 Tax=Bradyrhizobium sediminis TaxID=2840469 RepID=A0A975RNK6_9BRAD|nr:acyl-CoA dehydrogenase [Bradyrhizobium sediminis]QWG13651.1 acyl-CoA dehydrogenase [Bradyrhizobium sediminis]
MRQRYLDGLARGELIMSVGVSEPSAGSDVRAVRTRARREGDVWVIDGEKTWITNGAHFDLMICTCRTSDDPARGLSHFLIDRDEHPVATRPIEKLALNRHSTAQVFFDGVGVPAANMIGREGDALKNTLVLFERARLHVAAGSLGIARRALDESVRYAHLRKQRGKPIAAHQLIAAKLADMAIWVDAARLLIHRAAQMLDAGLRADMEAAMAKAFATEAAVDICRQAVQIHGGNGVTRGYIVERLAREALLLPIPDGTTEIQQLIIGRALTGISAF